MVLTNRILKTNGTTLSYNATNALDIRSGAQFNNVLGTIDLQNDAPINASVAGGSITNSAGQVIKKTNAGTTIINAPLDNLGTLQPSVNSAIIKLAGTT